MKNDTRPYECLICKKVGASGDTLTEWRSKTKCRKCHNRQNYLKYKDTKLYWKKDNPKNLIKA